MKITFQIIRAMKTLLLTAILAMASLYAAAQVAENDFGYNLGGTGFNGAVNASALQADGKLIVGGAFTSFNGKVNSSGSVVTTTRNYIARLNTDGTLDNTFNPGTGLGATVLSLAIQPSDGKIIVGGSFAAGVARLNTTGTVDGTFVLPGTGLNGYVQMVALQGDEKVIIGGTFTTYNTSTTRNRIARLNTVGTLDTGFDPGSGLNGLPRACAIQTDGKIIVVGGSSGFSSYNGTSRDNIVRVELNGAIDNTFVPPANLFAYLFDVKIQSDGKSVITGRYNGNVNSIFNGVARLNTTGATDNTFTSSFFTGGLALAIQSDGKIVIGGIGFGTSGLAQGIRRLTTAGASDSFMVGPSKGFEPPADSEIRTIAIQSDGRIIAGGTGFTSFNGIGRATIARITTCSSVSITTQPTSATTCATNNATFAVVASGTGLTYKWQVNSAALGVGLYTDITDAGVYTGATTTTLNITGATVGMNGYYYRCLVSDGACTTTSFSTTLTVHPTPVISTQPTDKTKCNNEIPTFTVAGTNLSTFQWQEDRGTGFTNLANVSANGVGYTGVTTATLSVLGPSVSYTGYKYRCIVGPPSGSCSPSVISSEAALTITASAVVTTQPVTGSICNTGNAVFQVAATGSGLTYQWQEKVPAGSFSNITNGGIYSGALTNQLTLTGASSSQNSNQYLCVITGSNTCSTSSNLVLLSVYSPPTISTHPANSTKCVGSSTTFTVAVTSPPAGLTYQWQEKIGSGSFANLANGGVFSTVTAATLTLTAVTAGMNGNKYRCVVGTCSTPVISFEADLQVDSPPVITLQPVAPTICAGMPTTFATNATGLGVTFQWQKETGVNFGTYANITNTGIYSGATTEMLTLTNVPLGETGFRYRCVITASGVCVAVNTSNVTLTVRTPPTFNTQPIDKVVCEGLTAIFSPSVNFNGAPFVYQWQVNSGIGGFIDLMPDAIRYPNGVTFSSLTVATTALLNGYKYRLRAGTCTPAVYSSEVTLTVSQTPAFTSQPIDRVICNNETTTFSVAAVGSSLTYRWLRNGTPLSDVAPYSGTTTSTLTITNTSVVYTGLQYSCLVTGATGCTSITSTSATLTVNNNTITTQPSSVSGCIGDSKTFSVAASGPSLQYQWQVNSGSGFVDIANGGIYSGATTSTLTLTGIAQSASYQCRVTGSCATLTSTSVSLTVIIIPKPVIVLNISNSEFPVLFTSGGSTYQWFKDGLSISGATSSTHNVSAEGIYTVQAFSSGCASEISNGQAVIITGDEAMDQTSIAYVYPNPARDKLIISLHQFAKGKEVEIEMIDLMGRIMQTATGTGGETREMNVGSFTEGRYLVKLRQADKMVIRHFIKSN